MNIEYALIWNITRDTLFKSIQYIVNCIIIS